MKIRLVVCALVLMFLGFSLSFAKHAKKTEHVKKGKAHQHKKVVSTKKKQSHVAEKSKSKMVRVVIQPNGWGTTPQKATLDLERVMRLYKDKQGFKRDRYVGIVHFARNSYQADGRCSYLVPRGQNASDRKALVAADQKPKRH
jgi:hypothetical protein